MPERRAALHPTVYAQVFEGTPNGAAILEELVARFGANPYVRGGHEGDRETAYRAGRNAVVHFILNRVNAANGVPTEEETDEG